MLAGVGVQTVTAMLIMTGTMNLHDQGLNSLM
jgi:hypothetical protein